MKFVTIIIIAVTFSFVLSCKGGSGPIVDWGVCVDYYIQNSSSYVLEIKEENRGPGIEKYENQIEIDEKVKVGNDCSIGGLPHPSEYFTRFEVYRLINESREVYYTGVIDRDWLVEDGVGSNIQERVLTLDDVGAIR